MASSQVNSTCLISDICCGINCCDPSVECCDGGVSCESKSAKYTSDCNPCIHDSIDDTCLCQMKDNGCSIGEYSCGNGCCPLGWGCSCTPPDGAPSCIAP